MQTTMAVEDIKVTLPELLDSLTPGDEVILTRNQQPVAKLVSEAPKPQPKRSRNLATNGTKVTNKETARSSPLLSDDLTVKNAKKMQGRPERRELSRGQGKKKRGMLGLL